MKCQHMMAWIEGQILKAQADLRAAKTVETGRLSTPHTRLTIFHIATGVRIFPCWWSCHFILLPFLFNFFFNFLLSAPHTILLERNGQWAVETYAVPCAAQNILFYRINRCLFKCSDTCLSFTHSHHPLAMFVFWGYPPGRVPIRPTSGAIRKANHKANLATWRKTTSRRGYRGSMGSFIHSPALQLFAVGLILIQWWLQNSHIQALNLCPGGSGPVFLIGLDDPPSAQHDMKDAPKGRSACHPPFPCSSKLTFIIYR